MYRPRLVACLSILSGVVLLLLAPPASAVEPSDTATATVVIEDSQAMALWFFLGTQLLLSIALFLRREGRAFRA